MNINFTTPKDIVKKWNSRLDTKIIKINASFTHFELYRLPRIICCFHLSKCCSSLCKFFVVSTYIMKPNLKKNILFISIFAKCICIDCCYIESVFSTHWCFTFWLIDRFKLSWTKEFINSNKYIICLTRKSTFHSKGRNNWSIICFLFLCHNFDLPLIWTTHKLSNKFLILSRDYFTQLKFKFSDKIMCR